MLNLIINYRDEITRKKWRQNYSVNVNKKINTSNRTNSKFGLIKLILKRLIKIFIFINL